MNFLPLHVYTGFSFLKSGLSMPSYVALAKKAGQRWCAVSDFQTMTGFPELAALCQKAGMTPVFGMDFVVDGQTLSAYVLNELGYKNLIQIGLLCSREALTFDALRPFVSGLYFIADGASPILMERSLAGETEFAASLAKLGRLIPTLSLGIPYLPNEKEYIAFLRGFVQKYPYPAVAFPHIRYAKPSDAIALSIVEAIANEETLTEKKREGDLYFLGEEILKGYYTEEELKESLCFLPTIEFTFAQKRGALPHFPSETGEPSPALLRRNAYEGLAKKNPSYGEEYAKRLEYELGVIEKMGYADYFLIVADYVNYAKTHGISVGPGRGSGAGSLVSYALGIVTPDPIKYGLLFERFLNPERQSMPDIDVDFADVRRDEIALYLQEKYGRERVAHIVTMQTLGAKASIRDVGRVFSYPERHVNMLSKAIGANNLSLADNYRTNEAFRTLVDSDPYYLEIVGLASKIEGLPRQAGLHAAGVVLSEESLQTVVPVADNPGVGFVAEYEMLYLEEQGVLKMDLLGLRNLTLVDHCVELLEKSRGIRLDYASIPYEDEDAIKVIASGKTMGLFQLESAGMNRAIAEVKPTTFLDIVAILSLFRPGPMENIPSYARRKAGRERISYPSPLLEPFLKETYGIIVYQEQIMQIASALAGFSFGQADLFRRAVSKKDATKLASLKDGFIKGCLAKGVDAKTANSVYDLIFKFANYGFNKSHALAYAILTCQMAYLKAHYPAEFYCAILDGTSQSDPKWNPLLYEIRGSGLSLGLPDINKTGTRFEPDGDTIVFPLTAIKGFQGNLAMRIVEERDANGPYKDFFDFACRNKKNGLAIASLVKIIDVGAFDGFGYSRESLRRAAPSAIAYAEMLTGSSGNEVLLGFDFPRPEIPAAEDNRMDSLVAEREALGVMVSGSPLEPKMAEIQAQGLHRLIELPEARREETYVAIVSEARNIVTKKGTRMAFVSLYDETSFVEVALFAEAFEASRLALKEGNIVKAKVYRNRGRDGYCASLIETL